jgi:hypothetical protein
MREMPLRCDFLVNVYNDFKFCLSLLETVGIRVPIQNVWHFPRFTTVFSHKCCSSAVHVSAVNTICKDTYIFRKQAVTLNYILKYF